MNTPGTVLSGGVAVTFPTAPNSDNVYDVHPFVGWQRNFGNFYLQGLHSLAIPVNLTDPDTVISNTVAAGFFLYRGAPAQLISAIVPTFEVSLDRNLTHPDWSQTAFAFGGHVQLYNVGTLGAAVVVPMGGPKSFDTETVINFNLRY